MYGRCTSSGNPRLHGGVGRRWRLPAPEERVIFLRAPKLRVHSVRYRRASLPSIFINPAGTRTYTSTAPPPPAPPSMAPHPLHHPALFRRMRASVRPGIPRATHARFVCRCAIKATSSEAEAAILCVLCVCVRVCGSCVYDKTRNRHDRIVCHKSGRTNTPKTNIPSAQKQCAKAAAERFGFECGHKLHTNTHIHIHNTTAVAWERACVRWINAAHRIHQRAHARARAAQEHKIAKWWWVSKPCAKLPTHCVL